MPDHTGSSDQYADSRVGELESWRDASGNLILYEISDNADQFFTADLLFRNTDRETYLEVAGGNFTELFDDGIPDTDTIAQMFDLFEDVKQDISMLGNIQSYQYLCTEAVESVDSASAVTMMYDIIRPHLLDISVEDRPDGFIFEDRFEEWDGNLLTNWAAYHCQIDRCNGVQGRGTGVRVYRTSPTGDWPGALATSDSETWVGRDDWPVIELAAGKTYKISLWARSATSNGRARYFVGDTRGGHPYAWDISHTFDTGGVWTYHESFFTATIPTEGYSGVVGRIFLYAGTHEDVVPGEWVEYDDVQIEEVIADFDDTPVTPPGADETNIPLDGYLWSSGDYRINSIFGDRYYGYYYLTTGELAITGRYEGDSDNPPYRGNPNYVSRHLFWVEEQPEDEEDDAPIIMPDIIGLTRHAANELLLMARILDINWYGDVDQPDAVVNYVSPAVGSYVPDLVPPIGEDPWQAAIFIRAVE